MQETPTITVLLTTYNRADLLPFAIKSVLNQTHQSYELIILDDCSPDSTSEVVASFNDPRINYVRNKKNLGFSKNFKNGIQMSRGKYIFLLSDDDCIVRTDTLLEAEKYMDKHNAGIGSMSLFFYEDNYLTPSYYIPVSRKRLYLPPSPENIFKTRTWHFGFMSGNIYRRSLIRLEDIGSDLWVAHLKPLWRGMVTDGCVYLGDHFILAKISTSGNIANLDLEVNKGYFLRTQLAMYQEFDPSTKRYEAYRRFHVEGVMHSFPGIKYFSSNKNTIAIAREILKILPEYKKKPLFWLYLGVAIALPHFIWSIVRDLRLRRGISEVERVTDDIGLASLLQKTLADPRSHQNTRELVSIGLIPYNGEATIKAAIESLQAQSYKNIEIIISDDASSDKTVEICKTYAKKDSRITLYPQKKNLGLAENSNFVLSKAKGTYFMWAADDDLWHKDYIRELVGLHGRFPQASLAVSNLKLFKEGAPQEHVSEINYSAFSTGPAVMKLLFTEPALLVWGLFKTKALRESGGFHSDGRAYFGGSDFVTICKNMLHGGGIAVTREVLFYKRDTGYTLERFDVLHDLAFSVELLQKIGRYLTYPLMFSLDLYYISVAIFASGFSIVDKVQIVTWAIRWYARVNWDLVVIVLKGAWAVFAGVVKKVTT